MVSLAYFCCTYCLLGTCGFVYRTWKSKCLYKRKVLHTQYDIAASDLAFTQSRFDIFCNCTANYVCWLCFTITQTSNRWKQACISYVFKLVLCSFVLISDYSRAIATSLLWPCLVYHIVGRALVFYNTGHRGQNHLHCTGSQSLSIHMYTHSVKLVKHENKFLVLSVFTRAFAYT